MKLTKDRSVLLDKLISDCITFGLHLKEALWHIKKEYGVISERTYFGRRKKLLSEETTIKWYSEFAGIRFVRLHSRITDDLERSDNDTNAHILESRKSPRNEGLIIKLKQKLEEIAGVWLQLAAIDTTIINAIREKIVGNK